MKLKVYHNVSQDDAALAAAAGGGGSGSSSSGGAGPSSSSASSAGILSLIKQNWKATHSAAKTRQEEMKDTTTLSSSGSKLKTNVNGATVRVDKDVNES